MVKLLQVIYPLYFYSLFPPSLGKSNPSSAKTKQRDLVRTCLRIGFHCNLEVIDHNEQSQQPFFLRVTTRIQRSLRQLWQYLLLTSTAFYTMTCLPRQPLLRSGKISPIHTFLPHVVCREL